MHLKGSQEPFNLGEILCLLFGGTRRPVWEGTNRACQKPDCLLNSLLMIPCDCSQETRQTGLCLGVMILLLTLGMRFLYYISGRNGGAQGHVPAPPCTGGNDPPNTHLCICPGGRIFNGLPCSHSPSDTTPIFLRENTSALPA